MAIRSDPTRQRFPGYSGRIIVDTWRGTIRIRKWPGKRKKKPTPRQQLWIDWFTEANRLAKHAPASQQIIAMNAAKGTGKYPRDLLVQAMGSGFFDLIEPDGTVITKRWPFLEEVMYQGAITDLQADLAIPGGLAVAIQWPLPVIDTANFWSAAEPDRFTIPTGVEYVQFTFNFAATVGVAGSLFFWVEKVTPFTERIVIQSSSSMFDGSLTSGPQKVDAGDQFTANIFSANARTLKGTPETKFSIEAKQVVI